MIVFDLLCPSGHRFEGWFASSVDFEQQQENGLLLCPQCGTTDIDKAPMAPAVPRKGSQLAVKDDRALVSGKAGGAAAAADGPPPELAEAMRKLASLQAEALKDSRWVGDRLAEESRAMFYGEGEAEPIHGQASVKEARELHEEGIPIAPLPFPVVPPKAIN